MLLDDDELEQVSGGGDAPVGGGGNASNSPVYIGKYGVITEYDKVWHLYSVNVDMEVVKAIYLGKDQLKAGATVRIIKHSESGWSIVDVLC